MHKLTQNTRTDIRSLCFEGGVDEHHAVIRIIQPMLSFCEQRDNILTALRELTEGQLPGARPVFLRFFLSDAANQSGLLTEALADFPPCACSIIEQPPLDGTKIALWVYLQTQVTPRSFPEGLTGIEHNGYVHLWRGSACRPGTDSHEQTRRLLEDYATALEDNGGRLADNCIRTWFFVQNIDVNYAGVVKARNEVFLHQGLTRDTHFIASTGIAGRNADPSLCVQLDTYAVTGLVPEQVHHLYASTHLNRTYEYGVSFERGTYVDYGDRRQVFISGTASIDNRGQIVHAGDIRQQTERMWENVEALLKEAGMNYDDIGQMIVYLRDPGDYQTVERLFNARFPNMPRVTVLAPVCRPGWLIEMECMGTCKWTDKRFRAF